MTWPAPLHHKKCSRAFHIQSPRQNSWLDAVTAYIFAPDLFVKLLTVETGVTLMTVRNYLMFEFSASLGILFLSVVVRLELYVVLEICITTIWIFSVCFKFQLIASQCNSQISLLSGVKTDMLEESFGCFLRDLNEYDINRQWDGGPREWDWELGFWDKFLL